MHTDHDEPSMAPASPPAAMGVASLISAVGVDAAAAALGLAPATAYRIALGQPVQRRPRELAERWVAR